MRRNWSGYVLLFLTLLALPLMTCRRLSHPSDKPSTTPSARPDTAGTRIRERTYTVTLYFQSARGPWLVAEPRKVTADSEENLALAILRELIHGPLSDQLVPTLPTETRVISVLLDEARKWIYVDFDKTLLRKHPGGSEAEIMTVYSIVNSLLANMSGYQRVWILIDNESRQVFKYHVFIGRPLPFNPTWIARANPP